MSEAGRTIAFYSAVIVALVYVAVRRSRPTPAEIVAALPKRRPPNYDELGMGPGGTAQLIPRRPAPYVPTSPTVGGPASGIQTIGPVIAT
jgi:hypothetical protein